MSSFRTTGRRTGHSRLPNPPLGRGELSQRGSRDASPVSDVAAGTSERTADVEPVAAAIRPTLTPARPVIPPSRLPRRSVGGLAATAAATRNRLLTQEDASQQADRSPSFAQIQTPTSQAGRIQPGPLARLSTLGQPRSSGSGPRGVLPRALPEHEPPTAVAFTPTPRAVDNPQPPVAALEPTSDQPTSAFSNTPQLPQTFPRLVSNNNSSISHAPNGSIINEYHNETHFLMYDLSADVPQVIDKGLGKHHVPGAVHDAQPSEAGCMEGTRVQLLADIKTLLNTRGGAHIIWIAGMAGTGKTSIALTLCRTVVQEPNMILGGTFFCSRSAGAVERKDVQRIIPTFAALLARRISTYAQALAEKLEEDPDLAHKSIRVQVERLLVNPLESLGSLDRQIIFVVDALDECNDEEKLVELINALAEFVSPAPVKFVFTSRPAMHIRGTSIIDTNLSSIIHLHAIDPTDVNADIRLYIQRTFEKATATSAWYTEGDIDQLAALSAGLFIFASTALAYILKRQDTPGRLKRLQTVKAQTSDSNLATAPLEKIYSLVLMHASNPEAFEPTELDETRRIVAVILSSRVPLTLQSLAEVVGLSSEHLRGTLDGLHAVIFVPEDDHEGEVRTLHTTFGDYIFSRAPEHIRIPKEFGHDELARGCLARLAEDDLCFNISRSTTSHKANPKAKPGWIKGSLIYASLHWAHHVHRACVRSSFDDMIESVFQRKLLFWFEVLSVLGEVRRASGILHIAASVVTAENVLLFLRDALSFVTSSHEAIKRSATHIYLSALPFTPKDSLIRKNFWGLFTGLPTIETFGIDHNAARCVMVIAGYDERVTNITYSPGGKLLASCSSESIVRLWDTRSGAEIRKHLTGTDEVIQTIAFTPDGHCLVAGTKAGRVFRWDIRTGHIILLVHRQQTHKSKLVALSPDGDTIASVSDIGLIDVWSTNTGQPLCGLLNGHQGSVWAAAFSHDQKTLACGGFDRTIRLWNYRLGMLIGEPLTGHQSAVSSLAFSLQGAFLASGSWDNSVRIWDIVTGQQHRAYHGHQDWVKSVAFAPDGHNLASASDDCTVCIWNFHDAGSATSSMVLRSHSDHVNAICYSNDGLYIASCSADQTIRVWNLGGNYTSVLPLDGHTDWVNAVAVSGDNRLIASASNDGSVRVWNALTCEQMYPPLLSHAGPACSVAFSSNSRWIATGSSDKVVRLWNAQTGEPTPSELRGHNAQVNAVAFSPDCLRVASGSDDRTVRVWDLGIVQPEQILQIECGRDVLSVAYSPNGSLIAAGEDFGDARIFDAATGQLVRFVKELSGLSCIMSPLVFSPDGARIVAPVVAGIVDVNIRTGTRVFYTQGHTGHANAIAYSPDRRFIASGAYDQTVRLWDAETMAAIEPILYGHAHGILSIAIFSDGQFVLTGSRDTTIRLWDLKNVRSLAALRDQTTLVSLAFARYKDGWLVSPNDDLLLWVPPEYRGYLAITGLCRVIAPRRVTLTAEDGVLHQGKQWTQCWRTDNSPGS